uniref:Mediator of RNA polymerase II transcription subunit 14 n=1 Tax=Strongyloides venezuelensis TaxID=75913 RepID=A0A0K0FU42_STRVS
MNYDGGNDSVPFGVLLKYSCHKISQELIVISELLPKYKDYNRKITITEFSYMARCLVSKILAIVKWLRSYNEHKTCKEIQSFLETQEHYFRDTADALCAIARNELVIARVPMYEVDAAVRLSYGQDIIMPLAIKKRFVPEKHLTKTERSKILAAINKNIYSRLSVISSILPSKIEGITIKNGIMTLTVSGEFEVSLTLFNDDLSTKWTLLDIKILIEQYDVGYGKKLVHPMQLFSMHQYLQQKMLVSKNPMVDLYNYLHDFCTSLQLDVLFCETSQLIGAQYKNKLIIEKYDQDGGVLIISFWPALKRKQCVPSQYKIKVFKDTSKLNNGLRVMQYPLRRSMPTLDLDTGRLSMCRLINETVLIYAKEKLFNLKEKLTRLKPYTYVEVTGGNYPKIDYWLFEESEHPEEECLTVHVNLFTGKFVLTLPSFKCKDMLEKLADMLNNDAPNKDLEVSIRDLKMQFLVNRIKKVYAEIKLPLIKENIDLKDVNITCDDDRRIFARITNTDSFIVTQLVANKDENEILFNFFVYEKRKKILTKYFSFYGDEINIGNKKLNKAGSLWERSIEGLGNNVQMFSQTFTKYIGKRDVWIGNYKNLLSSCYVILHEWQLNAISKAYSKGSCGGRDIKRECNNVPYLTLNSTKTLSVCGTGKVLPYEKCFMRMDDRWCYQKPGAYTVELFIRNVALKVDYYVNCPARENLSHKYGVKGTTICIPYNIYWLYPSDFTEKIAGILASERCRILKFYKLLEDIAPHYYKFFNQYCSVKHLSNYKIVFAYGEDRKYLLYLMFYGSTAEYYKFGFGQDSSINYVNDTGSDVTSPWKKGFNAHNNVHEHLLKWKLDKKHLHHLLLYVIKTCTPISILYNINIPQMYSGVFVNEMVNRNYQMKKLAPARLVAIDEYHIRLIFADAVVEFWIGSEDNVLICDVSKDSFKISGLHSVIYTYSSEMKLYNKPFLEMTNDECDRFFEVRNEHFQVNSNTLKKLCLNVESGNQYGVLIEYLHSQHIINHIKLLTKVYSLEEAECPPILNFFNISTTKGSVSFNVQYLLLDTETRDHNNINTIIYIDTNYFTLRIILDIDAGFPVQESLIQISQKYFEEIICYNYNNLSFFGFFKLLLTPSQDALNAVENIFRYELENTISHNRSSVSIKWDSENSRSGQNVNVLNSFVESNFDEGYVLIPVKITDVVKEKRTLLNTNVFHLKYHYHTGLVESTDDEEVYPNLNSYLLTYSKEARTYKKDPVLLSIQNIIKNYIPVLKS